MSDCQHNAVPTKNGQIHRNVQKQRQLSSETREKLLDDLMDCLSKVQNESDIQEIEKKIYEMEKFGVIDSDFDVDESLKKFHQKYDLKDCRTNSQSHLGSQRNKSRTIKYLARTAVVAAILCAFLIVAQACGFDLLGVIAQWSVSQFQFLSTGSEKSSYSYSSQVSAPDKESVENYSSLQEAFDSYNIQTLLAPNIYPENSDVVTVSVSEEKESLIFTASWVLPNGRLLMTVKAAESAVPFSSIEKDENEVEIYYMGGIAHYIMKDITRYKAVWYNEVWECRLVGDISREELLAMIDSIYR